MTILLSSSPGAPTKIPACGELMNPSGERTTAFALPQAHLQHPAPAPASSGMYLAAASLSSKGPDEACTQGSSGQWQLTLGSPPVLSPRALLLPH